MTQKEKAEDFILSFFRIQDEQQETTWVQAKKCALIAANELIKETGSKYWYNVKSEIEKL
jgi:hypothetical protein